MAQRIILKTLSRKRTFRWKVGDSEDRWITTVENSVQKTAESQKDSRVYSINLWNNESQSKKGCKPPKNIQKKMVVLPSTTSLKTLLSSPQRNQKSTERKTWVVPSSQKNKCLNLNVGDKEQGLNTDYYSGAGNGYSSNQGTKVGKYYKKNKIASDSVCLKNVRKTETPNIDNDGEFGLSRINKKGDILGIKGKGTRYVNKKTRNLNQLKSGKRKGLKGDHNSEEDNCGSNNSESETEKYIKSQNGVTSSQNGCQSCGISKSSDHSYHVTDIGNGDGKVSENDGIFESQISKSNNDLFCDGDVNLGFGVGLTPESSKCVFDKRDTVVEKSCAGKLNNSLKNPGKDVGSESPKNSSREINCSPSVQQSLSLRIRPTFVAKSKTTRKRNERCSNARNKSSSSRRKKNVKNWEKNAFDAKSNPVISGKPSCSPRYLLSQGLNNCTVQTGILSQSSVSREENNKQQIAVAKESASSSQPCLSQKLDVCSDDSQTSLFSEVSLSHKENGIDAIAEDKMDDKIKQSSTIKSKIGPNINLPEFHPSEKTSSIHVFDFNLSPKKRKNRDKTPKKKSPKGNRKSQNKKSVKMVLQMIDKLKKEMEILRQRRNEGM